MVIAQDGEVKFKYKKKKKLPYQVYVGKDRYYKHWDFNLTAREYERIVAEQQKKGQA